MNTPVTTTLDQRNSDPDAVPAEWDETRRVLEAAEPFWISTVRADGRPHVTPLVAVWVNAAIHFHTGASPRRGPQNGAAGGNWQCVTAAFATSTPTIGRATRLR